MDSRTSFKKITFRNAFLLPGMEKPHAPGIFDLQVDEEPLDVMWEAYHRRLTLMLTYGSRVEALSVTEAVLDEALLQDQQ
ncbi:hypothetical protein [Rhizobium sp. SSA_523]|uniref:hypothetical protein n=1 Tax=Rhizobium sp. SSA_523 TaxID=2952477 RepID=UPI002090367C|nr:hypothetical protein [Rhizobium sp. SSA_523]MCO5733106.1 hypothetical protein [Rhizobium sp. SSA_523]WKC23983.1 hypothetical protein QTJ18_24990 [Rhizobium sp. SSA_523]